GLGRLTSDVQYSTDDLLVSRPNRTEPLILQCTFKLNWIIYRPYIRFFLFTFSRNSENLNAVSLKGDFEGDFRRFSLINRSHRQLSLRRYHRRSHHRKKMDIPELPRRIHTVGEEPSAGHSISYHTCWALHTALKKALHDDEYEVLKESKLGVFIKFQELGFEWASRLVHYMLEFKNLTDLNCKYIEDLERHQCVVTKELTSFWGMLGVHVEAGPSTEEIIATLGRCEGWSQDDRKRLAYLAIFTGYIEGRKYSTPTQVSLARLVMELEWFENYPWERVVFKVLMDSVKGKDISGCYTVNGFAQALQVWVYTALPELGATYGKPLPNNPSQPVLAYKGDKEAILDQSSDKSSNWKT
ncbi:hypothetical protein IGI04_036251, partial [Brassica rapa subsp. trilocularis]